MSRPYLFCHMMTALDGKIMGNYMSTDESAQASDHFYRIAFGDHPHYQHQGWLSGRVTTDDNFTHYRKPVLNESAEEVPKGDFVAPHQERQYYISIDPSGVLRWQSNQLRYRTTEAHIIEVLTEKASNAYKAMLRELNISYIIVGKAQLDLSLILSKLQALFPIKTLMLGGGGVLNWSFIQAGLCDELSLVLAPVADGSSMTPTLFETREPSGEKPVGFKLRSCEPLDGGSLWLRYLINNRQSA